MNVDERLDFDELIADLTRTARQLWRQEPLLHGPVRTTVLLELHSIRFHLEDLAMRLRIRPPDAEDERLVHHCAVRLDRLTVQWA